MHNAVIASALGRHLHCLILQDIDREKLLLAYGFQKIMFSVIVPLVYKQSLIPVVGIVSQLCLGPFVELSPSWIYLTELDR